MSDGHAGSDTHATPAAMWAAAWSCLARGVALADAPARLVALSTVAGDGAPAARVVVLRGADMTIATVEVHTDAASAKVAELRGDARAAMLAWDDGQQLQIRLKLIVDVIGGAGADARWGAMPDGARANYGGTPAPGAAVAAPSDHIRAAERGRFVLLRGTVVAADLLHLGRDLHRRAIYDRSDGFAGRWAAP